MQGDPRCPHRWFAPACTAIPDGRSPDSMIISRPTTFCGRCGARWGDVEGVRETTFGGVRIVESGAVPEGEIWIGQPGRQAMRFKIEETSDA